MNWVAAAAVGALALILGGCSSSTGDSAGADSPAAAQPAATFAPTTAPPATFAPTTAPPPTFASTTSTTTNTTTTVEVTSTTVPVGSDVAALIHGLHVAEERNADTYNRDLFGADWIDADGDGCDTRCEVLERERRMDLPGLTGGGWLSVYDGYSTPDAGELDIDHMVPLAEAWRSGAAGWDGPRRLAFANDLDHPGSLIAVTAATNRAKGDRDPASWQPPNLDSWCGYVTDWVNTKLRWGLSADTAEVAALTNIVTSRGC